MSKNELIARIEALNEWEAIIEEAQAQADAIRNSIKEELADRGVELLHIGVNPATPVPDVPEIFRWKQWCLNTLLSGALWTAWTPPSSPISPGISRKKWATTFRP